jgi:release factor glutamine methyltransferase
MFEAQTPQAALAACRRALCGGGVFDAHSVARIILCDVLKTDMHGLLMARTPLGVAQQKEIARKSERVLRGEPVQYVVGYADFMGLRMRVTPQVLIPRFDTETLVAWAAERAKAGDCALDVCCGSGCVGIALKRLRPDVRVCACDISPRALIVAAQNDAAHQTGIRFREGDLCAPFGDEAFGLIVANPPYIAAREVDELSPRVRDFEPRLALDGGEDGLLVYRRLLPQAAARLTPGGALGVEIGFDQAEAVSSLFLENGLKDVRVILDMERRPRVVVGDREE